MHKHRDETIDWHHNRNLDFEISFYEKLVQEDPDMVEALIPLAHAYTKRGLYEKGLKVDKHLCTLLPNDPEAHYNLACSFALLDDKKQAIETLETAIKLGYKDFLYMEEDPDLDNIKNLPRYKALTQKVFNKENT